MGDYPAHGTRLNPNRRPVVPVAVASTEPATPPLPDGPEVEEQWGMRYLLNGQRYEAGDGGHVFDSRDQAAQHIEAWRSAYPTLTYTDVEYLRRQVITTPWEPADVTPAATEDLTHG